MSAGQDFASIRSSSAVEVISAVPPPFNPTALSRLGGRPVGFRRVPLRVAKTIDATTTTTESPKCNATE